jgi:hypothetical protein
MHGTLQAHYTAFQSEFRTRFHADRGDSLQGSVHPSWFIRKNHVIPAKAGIQMIKYFSRKRANIMVLSASQSIFSDWIPAFAGMTA